MAKIPFLPPVFTEIVVAKPKVNVLSLEVTLFLAAHESNTQSRNTFGHVEKDKTQQALCVPFPLQWGPIFAGRGQVISGHLVKRLGSQFGTNTKLLFGINGPISTWNDYLNTVFVDALSLRGSCS